MSTNYHQKSDMKLSVKCFKVLLNFLCNFSIFIKKFTIKIHCLINNAFMLDSKSNLIQVEFEQILSRAIYVKYTTNTILLEDKNFFRKPERGHP